jgi:hypothetical protein
MKTPKRELRNSSSDHESRGIEIELDADVELLKQPPHVVFLVELSLVRVFETHSDQPI